MNSLNKISSCRTTVKRILLGFSDAVRIRYPETTEEQILKDIGLVLASSGDRDGGRKKREGQIETT